MHSEQFTIDFGVGDARVTGSFEACYDSEESDVEGIDTFHVRCGQCEGFESVGKCEYLEDHGTYHSCKF